MAVDRIFLIRAPFISDQCNALFRLVSRKAKSVSFWRIWLAKKGMVKPLCGLLTASEKRLRLAAAKAISEINEPKTLPYCYAALNDKDNEVRLLLVAALGNMKDPSSVEHLRNVLKDDSVKVRRAAAKALMGYDPPDHYWGLIWMMAEGGKNETQPAKDQLKKQSKEILQQLRSALSEAGWSTRSAVARLLGELKEVRVVGALCEALKDEDADVRRSAAVALGEIKDQAAIKYLLNSLNDENEDLGVRLASAEALSGFPAPDSLWGHAWLLGMGSEKQKAESRQALKAAGPASLDPLLTAMKIGYRTVRPAAAEALGHVNDSRAIEPLMSALESDDWHLRGAAATALGMLRASKARQLLVRGAKDDEWTVRQASILALGRIRNKDDMPLITASLRDSDPQVRAATIHALGEMGDPGAVKYINSALRDPEEDVRSAAAEVLGNFEDEEAVVPLCNALKDINDNVRYAAAVALSKLKDPRAFEPLVGALNDWYSNVCRAVAEALMQYQPPQNLWGHAWLMGGGEDEERDEAKKIINEAGATAFEPLLAALNDWHSNVRCAAAKVLGDMGNPKAVEPLVEELGRRPLEAEVLDEVFVALGKIKKPGTGLAIAKVLAEHPLMSEDMHFAKKLAAKIKELAKQGWMTKQELPQLGKAYKKLLQ